MPNLEPRASSYRALPQHHHLHLHRHCQHLVPDSQSRGSPLRLAVHGVTQIVARATKLAAKAR
eukprot:10865664-Karenia_brevis.AAC.1